ncbi:MAG: hypothetical protein ABL958_10390 [Bdellovibrionia bacterium]
MEIEVSYKLFIQFLLLVFLAACGAQTERAREGTQQPGATPEPTNRGTIDGGGGNTLKGRPLESYRKDLFKVPSVLKYIVPMIQNVAKKLPQLGGDLYHIIEDRAWYFVPVELKKLPWYDINTPFETEQGAFQTRNEVWLDSQIFDKMEPADQAGLIAHELLMGIRRMEFTDSLDHCFANAAALTFKEDKQESYRKARRECWEKDKGAQITGPRGGGLLDAFKQNKLGEEDYSNVRNVTSKLVMNSENFDPEDLALWLAKHKFRDYGVGKKAEEKK